MVPDVPSSTDDAKGEKDVRDDSAGAGAGIAAAIVAASRINRNRAEGAAHLRSRS